MTLLVGRVKQLYSLHTACYLYSSACLIETMPHHQSSQHVPEKTDAGAVSKEEADAVPKKTEAEALEPFEGDVRWTKPQTVIVSRHFKQDYIRIPIGDEKGKTFYVYRASRTGACSTLKEGFTEGHVFETGPCVVGENVKNGKKKPHQTV